MRWSIFNDGLFRADPTLGDDDCRTYGLCPEDRAGGALAGCEILARGNFAQQKSGTNGLHASDWIDLGQWTVFDCGSGEEWLQGIVD